jgi:hypothetical protein
MAIKTYGKREVKKYGMGAIIQYGYVLFRYDSPQKDKFTLPGSLRTSLKAIEKLASNMPGTWGIGRVMYGASGIQVVREP